jgi:hypothetical protein
VKIHRLKDVTLFLVKGSHIGFGKATMHAQSPPGTHHACSCMLQALVGRLCMRLIPRPPCR